MSARLSHGVTSSILSRNAFRLAFSKGIFNIGKRLLLFHRRTQPVS